MRAPGRASALKVLLSFAAAGSAAAIAGLGTFATFTSSTSADQAVASGTVNIALGAAGTAANRLTIGASNIAAGDTIQRAANLKISGTLALSSTVLTTTASTSSALDTNVTNGLQMVIDKCSVPWTEAGVAPAYTYTCSGTTSSVLASRPVIGLDIALSNLSLTPTATDYLRVTLTLPSTSTLKGRSSIITYDFTATQRAATSA